MSDSKYTICCDFDGVIHSYTSPWTAAHVIPDPPVEGAIKWLNEIGSKFTVVIFTTRGKTMAGRDAVQTYFYEHGLDRTIHPEIEVTAVKPAALIYVDDRGYRFDGTNFPTADDIHRLRPWNKRPMGLKA